MFYFRLQLVLVKYFDFWSKKLNFISEVAFFWNPILAFKDTFWRLRDFQGQTTSHGTKYNYLATKWAIKQGLIILVITFNHRN